MIRINVLYPNRPGARFDMDYYAGPHMALVKERFTSHGLVGATVDKGRAGGQPKSEPPYCCIATLTFETFEGYKTAFKTHGGELLADVPNFTDVEPVVQISEAVV